MMQIQKWARLDWRRADSEPINKATSVGTATSSWLLE